MHFLYTALISAVTAIGVFFGVPVNQPAQTDIRPAQTDIITGAALPSATALFETSLAAPITSSATTLTLTANSVRGGGSLSGYNCFTIDEGTTQAETVCGTVSGTSVTSLTRGISQATGTTTVSALQFAHRRGANVKITDFPLIQILKAQNNGEDTFQNPLSYASGVTPTEDQHLVDKEYADDLAFNGAGVVDASVTARGVSEIATQTEVASSTDQGGSGILVIPASAATSTYNEGTAHLRVPVTGNDGFIDQGFLPATVTKDIEFTGTTTLASTTVLGSFRALDAGKNMQVFTTNGTFTVPEGVQKVWVEVIGGGQGGGADDAGAVGATSTFSTFVIADGGFGNNADSGGGGGGAYCAGFVDVSATTSVHITVGAGGAGGTTNNGTGGTGGQGGDCSGSATNLFEIENFNGGDSRNIGTGAVSGIGGGNVYGQGGQLVANDGSSDPNGQNGTGYGAGGSGGLLDGNGGNGTQGLVIVKW